MHTLASVPTGLVLTALALGLRHGIDWDHIAAITDLTGGQSDRRRSLVLSLLYAGGHALVVLVLGSLAIMAGRSLPESVDSAMEHVVGATLIALGLVILVGLARDGSAFRMQSRWMLVGRGLGHVRRRLFGERRVVIEHDHEHTHAGPHVHDHDVVPPGFVHDERHDLEPITTKVGHHHRHVHVGTLPPDPSGVSPAAAFGIGMLHGVGAETSTQVGLFATAAGVSSAVGGEIVLVAFLIGLLACNTAVAVAATTGFLEAGRWPRLSIALAAVAGLFSVLLGIGYLI